MHQMTFDEILEKPPEEEEGDDQVAGGDGIEGEEPELADVEEHGDPDDEVDE